MVQHAFNFYKNTFLFYFGHTPQCIHGSFLIGLGGNSWGAEDQAYLSSPTKITFDHLRVSSRVAGYSPLTPGERSIGGERMWGGRGTEENRKMGGRIEREKKYT